MISSLQAIVGCLPYVSHFAISVELVDEGLRSERFSANHQTDERIHLSSSRLPELAARISYHVLFLVKVAR